MRRLLAWLSCFLWLFSAVGMATGGTWTTHGFVYKPAIGARGENEKSNHDAGVDRVDARLAKETWVGDPNYGSTLQEAVAAIGANQAILRVPQGTHAIAGGLAIPANIALKPERGAILNVTIPEVNIEGLSQAYPCVVTWTDHGLSTGDKVTFSSITQDGWRGLNGCSFSITRINDASFSIPMWTGSGVFPDPYNPGTDPGKISKVLDIRGGLEAGEYQIFSADPGKVVIGQGSVAKILPQWWGAVADGVTDCAAAMQAAFYALETGYGGRVHFTNGIYYVASSVIPANFAFLSSLASPLMIYITGDNATLYTDQAISLLKRWPSEAMCNAYTYSTPVVDGLRFKGTSNRLQVGLDWGGSYSARITNCRFERLGRGLRLTYAINPVIENCMADACVVAGFTLHDGYGLWSNSHSWATNLTKMQNCRNFAPDAVAPVNIEGMTAANPCVVTWANHGLATGEVVFIDGITQANWTALNKRRFQITKINDSSFSLKKMNRTDAGEDVNTSAFGAYVPGADPGTIQAAVFGFELFNTYAITLDTCISEGGNLTDNIFFYSPAPATDFSVRNYYSENTPYGANLYLNYNGGLIKLDSFAGYNGNFFIDAYDMLATTRGVIETSGLLKGPTSQKIRIPEDNHAGYLSWGFTTNGGFGDTGVYLLDPNHWYGGHTPWQARTNDRFNYGHIFESFQVNLRGGKGCYVSQEPHIGADIAPGASYEGLRSEVNSAGGGGVGAYDASNSQAIMVKQKTGSVSITASGVTTQTLSSFIPGGVMVIGFTSRVTTAIGGATSFSIGDSDSATLWGNSIAVAQDTTSTLANATAGQPKLYAGARDVILTANGGNFNGTGVIRLTCHYIVLEPPKN